MSRQLPMQRRVASLMLVMAGLFAVLIFRLLWVQLVRGDELAARAQDIHLRDMTVQARRGAIYDRNGRELAISISAPSVAVIPPEVKAAGKADEVSRKLAEILGRDENRIRQIITQNNSWLWVARKIGFDQAEAIQKADLPGVEIIEESQRFYPQGQLAAHVLGIAGIDNQGLEGLELTYDAQLSGEPGFLMVEADAVGREIPHATHEYIPPEDGLGIGLNIDETIQYIAERELDNLMASPTNPAHAAIIVMEPRTGAVLALAGRPTYDPNSYGDFPDSARRNFAIADVYEPGSTFKIITTAAVLAEDLVQPNEHFYDPGYIKVGRETIKCWRFPRSHGSQTFAEGVANSCNPVFVTVGLRLQEKKPGLFFDYLEGFGFGSKTGIELPGEAGGILRPRDEAKDIDIAAMSIGQAVAVTPIQLITAAAAVANDGKLMRPHLVRRLVDKDGQPVQEVEPEVVRQVVSPEVARQVRVLLEGVVAGGTGSSAYIEGYRVGGKTGTAQKPGPGGYQEGKYVASFLGIAPVDDPRLAILVVIDEPQGYPYFGGQIAAPIFKVVMEESLRYLGVPRQQEPDAGQAEAEKVIRTVPAVTNLLPEQAAGVLRGQGFRPRVMGSGAVVRDQVPKGMAQVPEGTEVIIYLGAVEGEGELTVPDLTGMRLPQAAGLLEGLGLRLEAEGSGAAVEQDPSPGTLVAPGTPVHVRFAEVELEETVGP